jgi:hypothetical protein
MVHRAQERIALAERFEQDPTGVLAAVIDDDDLVARFGVRRDRGGGQLEKQREVFRLVLGGDEDRDVDVRGGGGSAL